MNASDPARPSRPPHSPRPADRDARLWPELVRLLAAMPDVVARLRAAHVPDRDGRCRACTSPGTGMPAAAWPCSLATLADAAARADRPTPPPPPPV